MLTSETWTKLQKKLKGNANYQYLLNYKFKMLRPAKTLAIKSEGYRLWELFETADGEWGLLNYLSKQHWFLNADWNEVEDLDIIVNKLIRYFIAICQFELIAAKAAQTEFPVQKIVEYVRLYAAAFFDRECILVFSELGLRQDVCPGIYFKLEDNFEMNDIKYGLTKVDLTSAPRYQKISGIEWTTKSINDVKIKDFQKELDVFYGLE